MAIVRPVTTGAVLNKDFIVVLSLQLKALVQLFR
jgi:hypothetical protein